MSALWLALGCGLVACSARPQPSPADEADKASVRPTLADDEPKPAVDGGTPAPQLVGPAGDPFAVADREIDPAPPADVPMAPVAAPPTPAKAFDAKHAPRAVDRFDEYVNVRALASSADRIYFADMTGRDGKIYSKIRAVDLDDGEVSSVRPDDGRIDALALSSDASELSWVSMPLDGGAPALWTMPLSPTAEEAEPVVADANYGTANHLTRLGDALFFVLPVTQQGRKGGIGRVPAGGGEKLAVGRSLGPAFSPVTDGERLYFMAHRRGAPDVVYSVDPTGSDLRAHVSVPRGIVALQVDGTHVYWARIGVDGRSTEVGRVPKAPGEGAPEVLVTIADVVFETMAVSDAGIWLGTSAAEPAGKVVQLDKATPANPRVVLEAPRIWKVFAQGDRVFVHVERPGDDGQAHRAFVELRPS